MNNSFDDLDCDYAVSVAGRAMQGMAARRIPPTPNNFAVWFHYFIGARDDLRGAIDLLVDHVPLTPGSISVCSRPMSGPTRALSPLRRPSGCLR
jgi:hypothetical protein